LSIFYNFLINNSIVNIYLDSEIGYSVHQLDNRRIYRADDTYPVRDPTTSGYGIDIVWRDKVFISNGGLTNEQSDLLLQAANQDGIVEGDVTVRKAIRGVAAVLLAKSVDHPDGPRFRNFADTKDVVTSPVDNDGNRSAPILDLDL
jgi:hypothetical protein